MAFTFIDMSDCFLSSANTEQHFIEGIAKLVPRQIAGGGGGEGGGGGSGGSKFGRSMVCILG